MTRLETTRTFYPTDPAPSATHSSPYQHWQSWLLLHDRGVVDAALRSCPDAQEQREQLTLPKAGAHDGGYFAVIVRRPAIG